jgi:hypothetical protein
VPVVQGGSCKKRITKLVYCNVVMAWVERQTTCPRTDKSCQNQISAATHFPDGRKWVIGGTSLSWDCRQVLATFQHLVLSRSNGRARALSRLTASRQTLVPSLCVSVNSHLHEQPQATGQGKCKPLNDRSAHRQANVVDPARAATLSNVSVVHFLSQPPLPRLSRATPISALARKSDRDANCTG